MVVEFDKSFLKILEKVNNPKLFSKVEKIILSLENAEHLNKLSGIKKLSGFKNYYRIKIGEYRLGMEKINKQTIRFILIAHRKDIYKRFP